MRVAISLAAIGLITTGCAAPFETMPSATPVVPVALVLNSLKCGLAEAIQQDRLDRSGLRGAVAKVELDVNVVQGIDASGKISVGIPIWAGAIPGLVTPSFSVTRSEVRTFNSSVDFDILLTTSTTSICDGVLRARDSGFSDWIGAVVADVNVAVGGAPRARMKQYIYESDFTVKTGGTAGLDVEVVPIKLNTSSGSSRTDIQHLKITIDAVRRINNKIARGGGREFSIPAPVLRRGDFNRPTTR